MLGTWPDAAWPFGSDAVAVAEDSGSTTGLTFIGLVEVASDADVITEANIVVVGGVTFGEVVVEDS